ETYAAVARPRSARYPPVSSRRVRSETDEREAFSGATDGLPAGFAEDEVGQRPCRGVDLAFPLQEGTPGLLGVALAEPVEGDVGHVPADFVGAAVLVEVDGVRRGLPDRSGDVWRGLFYRCHCCPPLPSLPPTAPAFHDCRPSPRPCRRRRCRPVSPPRGRWAPARSRSWAATTTMSASVSEAITPSAWLTVLCWLGCQPRTPAISMSASAMGEDPTTTRRAAALNTLIT